MEKGTENQAIEPPVEMAVVSSRVRRWVVVATLAALFLGALDALVMSAAMPTIIADLGGLDTYSWVYSAYFLSRVVSLPIFGKLADLFPIKRLFVASITVFLMASMGAGASPNMAFLVVARVFQGIGAGGIFALVYIVLADIAAPGKRAKLLSLASSVWGIASVLGPTLGGFVVTYFSWRWIFYINVPVSLFSMTLVAVYLVEVREKKDRIHLDILGVLTLSIAVLGLLTLVMIRSREPGWLTPVTIGLAVLTLGSGIAFYFSEKHAMEPILSLAFFRIRAFSIGNSAVFLSSFAIFSLFAYAPLFIQGALGKTPMEVGLAMVALSLGWSLGSFLLGQFFDNMRHKTAAVLGAVFLGSGAAMTLTFDHTTGMTACFWVFFLVGLGMGFVTLATLLIVQSGMHIADLGVATSSHQFARTLGGAIGVGVSGGFVTANITGVVARLKNAWPLENLPPAAFEDMGRDIAHLFQPAFQAGLPADLRAALQQAVGQGVQSVFWIVLVVSIACLICCLFLPSTVSQEA